jgi:hypothetical protein
LDRFVLEVSSVVGDDEYESINGTVKELRFVLMLMCSLGSLKEKSFELCARGNA